ncbi:MAG: tetratricopeptide repeat protein [Gemmatimonadales bacterium]
MLLALLLLSASAAQEPEAISLLGRPLVPPALSDSTRRGYERKLDEARRAYDRTPNDPDSIIWLGRRTAYLGRYREAIAIYTRGIAQHPGDARLYRHRGHRYLTVRLLDSAIADFERAAQLIEGKPDQVEPDGLPNARGIPTSTLHSNIRYHLGLAYYLKGDFERALGPYRADVQAARATGNNDMLVATSHWLYMALRRLGRRDEAARGLEPIRRDMDVIENGSYHRLLLLYKGELPVDSLLPARPKDSSMATVEDVTTAYGVANWHYYEGRTVEAIAMFRRIVASPAWAAFGYLAAEAELARLQ